MGQLNLSTYWEKGGAWLSQDVFCESSWPKNKQKHKSPGCWPFFGDENEGGFLQLVNLLAWLLRKLRLDNPGFGNCVRMH